MASSIDSIYRTHSSGAAEDGVSDQYSDGRAARLWQTYIGGMDKRTAQYRAWICDLLRRHGARKVLDAACGTGVDSIMLVEEGFQVVSIDLSDKMLKYALKERWSRRKDPAFDRWIIEEGNWLTLVDDVESFMAEESNSRSNNSSGNNGNSNSNSGSGDNGVQNGVDAGHFDAIICLGNSFAHLPDFQGHQENHRRALDNFKRLLRPGGILVVDHRNYDEIIDTGHIPPKNVYYNSKHIRGIKCSMLNVDGHPTLVTMDFDFRPEAVVDGGGGQKVVDGEGRPRHHFRVSFYPHRVKEFTELLKDAFGRSAPYQLFGDFQPIDEVVDSPAYYIHVVQRTD